jgi:hypothetical protein
MMVPDALAMNLQLSIGYLIFCDRFLAVCVMRKKIFVVLAFHIRNRIAQCPLGVTLTQVYE